MRRWLTLGFLAALPAFPAFAHEVPVLLQGHGPYYRLDLPLSIYQGLSDPGLSDLRLRNAAGRDMPFAWLDPWLEADLESAKINHYVLPQFSVPRQPKSAADGLGLRVGKDGRLSLLALGEPASAGPDLIFDASRVRGEFLQATFELAPGMQGLFTYQLEGSEDLKTWQPLAGDEQLARLRSGEGQAQIERLQLDLQGRKARYLRLRWLEPANSPRLQSLSIAAVQSAQALPALQWTAPIAPSSCGPQSCDYPLPGPLPLHALRIELLEPNVLAPVTLSGLRAGYTIRPTSRGHSRNPLYALRHKEPQSWSVPEQEQGLASSIAYRIQQGAAETRSPDLVLDGSAFQTLRLRSDSGPIAQLGARPPLLRVGSQTRSLLLLASGPGPYALSWQRPPLAAEAAAAPGGGPLTLAALLPGEAGAGPATLRTAGQASLDWAQRQMNPSKPAVSAPKPPDPQAAARPQRGWLWAALGLAVLVLGGMVGSLLRSMGKEKAEQA
ncbi:hypothetical protein HNP55_001036 [Paucibacter oligotrophus]|uniref:DUF3999 domain-containing protein n=1 Tax=Roseateles oligotrophus TaxID=1769250 RepID=A0A840L3Z5_9BURK|nr:DUF3999 family protein [Roseateles oligotrophus]MBB4842521.1 hypothetical protein [Roseateles oligotrophus]